jgi:hypothetical protein
MGFSKDDIDRASKIANEKNVDIIDVLTNSNARTNTGQRYRLIKCSSKSQRQVNPFVYRSLIKPRNQIVMDEYDCIFR